MLENGFWRNRDLRKHVSIIDGITAPTLVLKNGTYLNMYTKKWLKANIWIYCDRIVYVGGNMPINCENTEIVDCTGKYLVPGYVEMHAHPFQLYNPESLAMHAANFGTTTLVNDNLMWRFLLDKKKAFSLIGEFDELPVSMYWWSRFDSQTVLLDEEALFNTEDVLAWLKHPSVVQGGELTSWPSLLNGDDILLYWMQKTKQLGKPIEGHFPGASEKTLTKLKLLGVNGDHESITGKDVIKRMELGYQTGLRYSSIRPDLPRLLEEILAENVDVFDSLSFTTDGGTPAFYKDGLINTCIKIAIEKGVPLEEAYRMGSYNPSKHLHLEEKIGSIAPGRLAHINILTDKNNPDPESVLAKGKWIRKDDNAMEIKQKIDWANYDLDGFDLSWDLSMSDLQFSLPIGLDMVNDVIMKPYAIQTDITPDQLPENRDDAFLLLMDRNGQWRSNTTLRGFTKNLGGLASSYSTTGDLVFIGKNKHDMLLAFNRLKEIGGGIVVAHQGEILAEIPLKLSGVMFDGEMYDLIEKEEALRACLGKFGYSFGDPVYSILFLSSTHLPYIRITQKGIVDVKKREVLFPSTMR